MEVKCENLMLYDICEYMRGDGEGGEGGGSYYRWDRFTKFLVKA